VNPRAHAKAVAHQIVQYVGTTQRASASETSSIGEAVLDSQWLLPELLSAVSTFEGDRASCLAELGQILPALADETSSEYRAITAMVLGLCFTDASDIVERYWDTVTVDGCAHMLDLADLIMYQPSIGTGLAEFVADALRRTAKFLAREKCWEHISPIAMALLPDESSGESQDDPIATTIEVEAKTQPWLFAILQERFIDRFEDTPFDEIHRMLVRAIATVQRYREGQLHSRVLSSAIERCYWTQIREWLKLPPGTDLHGIAVSMARVLSQFESLVAPLTTLQLWDEIREPTQLSAWVVAEPWLVSEAGMSRIQDIVDFNPAFARFQMILATWRSEWVQSTSNELVRLVDNVLNSQVSIDQALIAARVATSIDVVHLAVLDAWIHEVLIVSDPKRAGILSQLCHARAMVLNSAVIQGYATLTLGICSYRDRAFETSRIYLSQAWEIAVHLDHVLLQSYVMQTYGNRKRYMGDHGGAAADFDEAFRIASPLPSGFGHEALLLDFAEASARSGALDAAEQAVKAYQAVYSAEDLAGTASYRYLEVTSAIARARGDDATALQRLDEYAEVAGRDADSAREVHALRLMSRIHLGHGDFATANDCLERAAELADAIGDDGEIYVELAMTAVELGRLVDASVALEKARRVLTASVSPRTRFRWLMLRGTLYNAQNNYEKAKQTWEEALRVSEEHEVDAQDRLNFLVEQSYTLVEVGNVNAAISVTRELLASARRLGNTHFVNASLRSLCAQYLMAGKLGVAAILGGIASRVSSDEPRENHQSFASTLADLEFEKGLALWSRGEQEAARQRYKKAETLWLDLQSTTRGSGRNYELRSRIWQHLGNLYLTEGLADEIEAAACFRRSVTELDDLRFSMGSTSLERLLLPDLTKIYHRALSGALRCNAVKESVEIAELMRARLLGNELTQRIEMSAAIPSELQQKYLCATAQVRTAQEQWLRVHEGLGRGRLKARNAEMDFDTSPMFEDLHVAQREYDEVCAEIAEIAPGFESLSRLPPASFDELKAFLDAGTLDSVAVVHLCTFRDGTVALVSSKTLETPVHLTLDLKIDQQLGLLLSFVYGSVKGWQRFSGEYATLEVFAKIDDEGRVGSIDALATQIGRLVWKKLHPVLQELGCKTVLFVPDMVSSILPLQVGRLLDEEDSSSGRRVYAAEVYDIRLTPSVQILQLLKRRTNSRTTAATGSKRLFAQAQGLTLTPLVVSNAERAFATSLTSSWDLDSRARQSVAPTKRGLDLLMIHAHGYYDPLRPERTRFGVSLETGGDLPSSDSGTSLLDLLSSSTMDACRIVILSACEMAMVDVDGTHEIFNLPTVLMLAGASCVLASSWAVDELSTVLLLRRLTNEIAARPGIHRGLARAQAWLRQLSSEQVLEELVNLREENAKWRDSQVVRRQRRAAAICEDAIWGQIARLEQRQRVLSQLHDRLSEAPWGGLVETILPALRGLDLEIEDPLLLGLTHQIAGRVVTLVNRERDDAEFEALLNDVLQEMHYPFVKPYYWAPLQVWGMLEWVETHPSIGDGYARI
jgi:CHAT domain-containing protein/tetratricopeptide (TPR) repeat protein